MLEKHDAGVNSIQDGCTGPMKRFSNDSLMLQTMEVGGIGIPFKSSAFFPILGLHILAGLVCVVAGILTMASKKRLELQPRCGTIYHWGLAVPSSPEVVWRRRTGQTIACSWS
jgi:hypothetical protein